VSAVISKSLISEDLHLVRKEVPVHFAYYLPIFKILSPANLAVNFSQAIIKLSSTSLNTQCGDISNITFLIFAVLVV